MPDSKTKIRPQQSCLRCRERKVKCDRSVPCHACIIRGLEAECTYLTTAEDRAHISQSEIINQLRREVSQLRERLNRGSREPGDTQSQHERPGQGAGPHAPAHNYDNHGHGNGNGAGSASAGGTPDTGEGSWRGSSPASSIITNSVTVTSPDSTGSENGTRSTSASSRSTSTSACPIATGYPPQIAELDGPTVQPLACRNTVEDTTMFGCYTGGVTFPPGAMTGTVSVPMQGLPVHALHAQDAMLGMHYPSIYGVNSDNYMLDGEALPYLQHTGYPAPILTSTVPHYGEEYSIRNEYDRPHAFHHWGQDAYGNSNPSPNQFPQTHIYQTPSHYSTIPFTNITANTNINTYAGAPFFPPAPTHLADDTSSHAGPNSQDRPSPTTIMNSMPSSWKGEGKQELLEILLETIGSCDEQRLPQVIQVLRTSPSPEEAVSGVCQVLGIGTGRLATA
ncbi:transcriptional regulator family: Fungal Specific TF [Penicillium psychrosexuale]|uniref:transcriptional regulator family: Fungal Specific TF n=1 Tax=Penicillium psychrosexuale TaxID=1002107 RepID=UPI002544DC5B|nr:transcriptional regulator family: Fungal Specific TF [Penicillium psychrosexuale]KAJ5800206.1 transcriptional regulator family: Fungal Specific TF [Penicillium psychrosexuale]